MTQDAGPGLERLAARAATNVHDHGVDLWKAMDGASRLHLLWNDHLVAHHLTGSADCLLTGAGTAAREAALCLALGLVRPALNSLRTQIDLSMAWLYFRDHPVEWRYIQSTGENFKLKKELLEYLGKWHPNFNQRWKILLEHTERAAPDPYRILSAHMHGQSEAVIPVLQNPEDLVAPMTLQREAVVLQASCSEFISDLFWCFFFDSYHSIPGELQKALVARFKTAKQRGEFFKQ